ncbi:MAG: SpoIIE family protein phosphatase [Deferribacteres bacterium]|nr:SpoIIE family protein phosphatase [Deferribacteres bacterium]
MQKNWKKILLSTPILLYLGLLCVDAIFYFIGIMPELIRIGREVLLVALLLLFIPYRQYLPVLRVKQVIPTLRRLFIIAIAIAIFFQVTSSALSESLYAGAEKYKIAIFLKSFILSAFSSLILVLLFLVAFGIISNLLFYKSKKTTQRNFRLLGIALLCAIAAAIWGGPDNFRETNFFANNFFGITSGILVLIMVMNAFRLTWIDFLSRKEKWSVFLLSPVVAVIGLVVYTQTPLSYLTSYSVAWAAFISLTALFISIYAIVCTVLLLLRLPTAAVFDERVRAIKSMQKLSQLISHYMPEHKLINLITEMTTQFTGSDYAWLELQTSDQKFVVRAAKNVSESEIVDSISGGESELRNWILHNKQSVLINDAMEDTRTAGLEACKKKICSLLAVPLLSKEKVLGILYAARKEINSYNEFDQDILESFAAKAAISFENSHLLKSSLEKERLEQELQIAHEAQLKLLPKQMPTIEGLDVSGVSVAAREVGGDFYGVYKKEESLRVVIGDVSGKGTAAAFYMAELKGVVEALGSIYSSPRDILIKTNSLLCESLEKNLFVTLQIANFDMQNRQLVLSRAGHNPIIWLPKAGNPKLLKPSGIGIGLDNGAIFDAMLEELKISFSPGDYFIFYTDGVIEARDARDEEFEEAKLLDILQKDKFSDAKSLKNHILDNLRQHIKGTAVHDDYTLVVVGIQNSQYSIKVGEQEIAQKPELVG